MSWSPDLFIGELRPWPDTVHVVRGKTDETRRYVPEEMLFHERDGHDEQFERARSLEDENARLRSCLSDDAENARMIMAENAKLRELVRNMYACISHANEQDWFYFERDKFGCGMSCTVNGEVCGLCVLADRMRELGVEVDG